MSHSRPDPKRRRFAEEAGLDALDLARDPLYRELVRLEIEPEYLQGQAAHLCCTRRHNRMRISPLEALSIARAFRRDPELRRRLPGVLARLRRELTSLTDNEERQPFDCPLLEDRRCLVHDLAKPIGCLAWHPPGTGEDLAAAFTRRGYDALAERDRLNDRLFGPNWKLKVIPLALARVLGRGSAPDDARRGGRKSPSRATRDRREGPPRRPRREPR